MPSRKRKTAPESQPESAAAAPARPTWSGTITFGLVSIPVDLFSAVRPRQTAMKLVDKAGHPLGRQYHCSKECKKLDHEDLVRGYQTDAGKVVVITDAELESVAPEMSGDIELRSFVPLEQIPPMYFQRPYFLAPAGKSAKAYHLLAKTMERTGRVGIGSFVMRGHEYLVAIVSDNGVLRADTLRYADEIRTPESVGLPKRAKAAARKINQFSKEIDQLTRHELNTAELADSDAEALQGLAQAKQKQGKDVIHQSGLEDEDAEESAGGAQIIDLMAVLRKSLSKRAVVTNANSSPPISLAERRAQRAGARPRAKKQTAAKRKAPRKLARRTS